MPNREQDEINRELDALEAAHTQNEAGRDTFVGLSHTALFAASVSFVGNGVPVAKAIWRWALVLGWSTSVLGLIALTISFTTARKAIDERRAAIYSDTPPTAKWSDRLNAFSLWSFPIALIFVFAFVSVNVMSENDKSPPATQRATSQLTDSCAQRDCAADEGTEPKQRAADGSNSGTSSAIATPSTAAITAKKGLTANRPELAAPRCADAATRR